MTKEDIENLIFETCSEGPEISTGWESGYDWSQTIKLMTAAYNLALDHAAEKVKIQEDYLHPKINGQTRVICKSSAYNLRFTQDNTVSITVNKESILNLKITE